MQYIRGVYSVASSRHRQAFTIIELLVVIMIIGLLTSVATASYLSAQKHARDTARKSSVNSIAAALEAYFTVTHRFPGDAEDQNTNLQTSQLPSGKYASCEGYTNLTETGVGYSPYYFYSPQSTLPGAPDQCNNTMSAGTGINGSTATFGGQDTWLPELNAYLSPIPIESSFANANGETTESLDYSDVCDYLDSTRITTTATPNVCAQSLNQTRTLIYRNLGTGYAVYARLESDADTDFSNQFSQPDTTGNNMCIPNQQPGMPDLQPEFDCVPNPAGSTNPIIVYTVRK